MLKRVLAGLAVLIVLALVAFGVWANMVMPGDREAALKVWNDTSVSVTSTDHSIVMTPSTGESTDGLVFIPGAKVDPYAYMYKLSKMVEQGRTVVITKPTLNLAFFDSRPLDTFEADAPWVENWAVGGHSLGGVKACMLAEDSNVTELVLLGSYCANDLSRTDLTVISYAGANDGLSTPDMIADSAANLPPTTAFIEIAGANHASFGDYGVQPGDGEATISSAEMRDQLNWVVGIGTF